MKCKILHESNGRMRLHAEQTRMTLRQADILEAYLRQVPGVTEVKIYDRTCDAVVLYRGARTDLIRALRGARPGAQQPRPRPRIRG